MSPSTPDMESMDAPAPRPTVSPSKKPLAYFISIGCIDHPVWKSHREEAKRGLLFGHRIPRNEEAMMSLLLPYATIGVSRIAGWCWIGATPRGQPQTPAMLLLHGGEGLCVRRMTVWWTCRRPFMGRPVPRQLLRNTLLDLTTIMPATAYNRVSYTERYSRFIREQLLCYRSQNRFFSLFPITGAYRQRPRRSVARGAGLVFPDNRSPLVYRKHICACGEVLAKGKEGRRIGCMRPAETKTCDVPERKVCRFVIKGLPKGDIEMG